MKNPSKEDNGNVLLQEEVTHFEQLLKHSPQAVVVIDTNGLITFYNDAAKHQFGYKHHDVLGEAGSVLFPARFLEQQLSQATSAYDPQSGRDAGYDLELMRKDGSTFQARVQVSKTVSEGHEYLACFIDAATNGQDKDNELEAYVKAINTGWSSIEFEPNGTILSANENFLNCMGYTDVHELVGHHHSMLCEPSYAQSREYQAFWRDLASGNVRAGEFKRIRKDGKEVYILATYTPIKDASGKVSKVIKIATDTTSAVAARVQADAVMSAVDTGWASIEFEPDGTILTANERFLQTMGYHHVSDLKGRHHRIFCDEQYANSPDYTAFWKALSSGNIQSGEFKRVTRDGKEVWLNASYTPIKDSDGQVFKVIKIAADITSVKVPVLEVRDILQAIAEGDLSKTTSVAASGYVKEMGEAVDKAVSNLNMLLSNISHMANQVASSSEEMLTKGEQMQKTTQEVSSAIQQMAEGAQQQAMQTDEASKLIEAVLRSAGEMGEKAQIITTAADSGQKSSSNGRSSIQKVVHNMEEIQGAANVTSDSINILTERSEEIARTLNVITDIAAQTNLLALNAAIEAARAGDAGRGFAVVAEEIRKLAEDSRKSAIDIERVINEVQKDVGAADKAINMMEASVKSGNQASLEAQEVFQAIESSSSETLKLSKDILESTGDQKASINETVKNIEKIVVVSEETAAGSEQIATSSRDLSLGMDEVAATSKNLADLANQLQDGISQFKLMMHA